MNNYNKIDNKPIQIVANPISSFENPHMVVLKLTEDEHIMLEVINPSGSMRVKITKESAELILVELGNRIEMI